MAAAPALCLLHQPSVCSLHHPPPLQPPIVTTLVNLEELWVDINALSSVPKVCMYVCTYVRMYCTIKIVVRTLCVCVCPPSCVGLLV